jgi:hypothetical protein
MRAREQPKIDIYVRQYNRIYRKKVGEYWGTVNGFSCQCAVECVKRDVIGPAGVVARTGEKVFARFRKPMVEHLRRRRIGDA